MLTFIINHYLKPYTVTSTDYSKTHFCRTFSEALEWSACYPGADVVCIHLRGVLVSLRHGQCARVQA